MTTLPQTFPLGEIVATPGAVEVCRRSGEPPETFLLRHAARDWGEVCREDWDINDAGCRKDHPGTLHSVYHSRWGEVLWVITEWDRSVTTLLRPGDY